MGDIWENWHNLAPEAVARLEARRHEVTGRLDEMNRMFSKPGAVVPEREQQEMEALQAELDELNVVARVVDGMPTRYVVIAPRRVWAAYLGLPAGDDKDAGVADPEIG